MQKNLNIVKILVAGGVGVLPTDTIYGIVGSALLPKTVARIYRLRRRDPKKPMIILAASKSAVKQFGVSIDPKGKILDRVWPGKVSVILPVSRKAAAKFRYLHRGTNALAFRVPRPAWLRALLKKTGPLIAPSANFEGKPPASTIREAKKYFGDKADFYVDHGRLAGEPSALIKITKRDIVTLRGKSYNKRHGK